LRLLAPVQHRAQLSRNLIRPTCLEAAHHIQVLTYLLVACQQEVIWRCRTGRPRIGPYGVHLYRAGEGGGPTRHKHLAIERTRGRPVVIPAGYRGQWRPGVGGNVVRCEPAASVSLCAVHNVRRCHQRTRRRFTAKGHRRAALPHSSGKVHPVDVVHTRPIGHSTEHIEVRRSLRKAVAHVRYRVWRGGAPWPGRPSWDAGRRRCRCGRWRSCRRMRSCCCSSRGRRGTPTARGYVVHTHAWCQHRCIARERREHIQIFLDPADCRQAVVAGHPVDHRQRIRAFGQQYLELRLRGTRGAVEVVGLPPDDELPVWRTSHRLGEDTAVWAGTHSCIGN